ncbi:MAG TPA: DNA polymerase III subunit delta' [Caulobacteraceae bacterium]|nr:DNA polymerase III subunit delta' [Caulobacteraceae bacterium]
MSEAARSAHPRDVFTYEGGQAVESEFLAALDRGRLHHAWLLTGPEGVGKATFAYRAARLLLGARPDAAFGLLGADPADPVSRQVASRSHPDLLVLERQTDDGKARKSIPVEEVRRLPEFFSKAPASAPYRVAIVDAADDLNVNAANALLKTLEEPPSRGVLLLVSHRPGALIATIRSRCRRLAFAPWSDDRVAQFLGEHTGLAADERRRIAHMAKGGPGRALYLAEAGALAADALAHEILSRLPETDDAALLAVADGFRGAEGQKRFELLFECLGDQIRAMALNAAQDERPSAELERWARVWGEVEAAPGEAEAINLDRADVLFTTIGRLKAAARA